MRSCALADFYESRRENRIWKVRAPLTKWSDFCPAKELDYSIPFKLYGTIPRTRLLPLQEGFGLRFQRTQAPPCLPTTARLRRPLLPERG